MRNRPPLPTVFQRLCMTLYSAALSLGLLLAAPWWLFRMATTQRYREGLRQRLGFVPAALRTAPAGVQTLWLHAVSVGEVIAATLLVEELERALATQYGPSQWRIVVSTTTRTGQAMARRQFAADNVFYMPLDFAWAVRAWLRALQPAAVILVESEIWPRVLHECRRYFIPVAVVNARLSDRSFRRALRVRRAWSPVLRGVTLWLAQSEQDATRLRALGVGQASIHNIGNLKYDARAPESNAMATLIRRVAAGRPILVAGSTVGPHGRECAEEELVLAAWQGRLHTVHAALLVLAPRHPERFAQVARLSARFGSLRATSLAASFPEIALPQQDVGPLASAGDIIVLDTLGDLAAVYGVATAAFLGGSLVRRGGHNPLEAARFGVPVVIGSSYENFRDVVATMLTADGLTVVEDQQQLEATWLALLADPAQAAALGRRGQQVFEQQQGATLRATAALLHMVTTHGTRKTAPDLSSVGGAP